MENPVLSELKGALELVVAGKEVARALDVLDRLLEEHRDSLEKELRHFLERRSYIKALEYLKTDG